MLKNIVVAGLAIALTLLTKAASADYLDLQVSQGSDNTSLVASFNGYMGQTYKIKWKKTGTWGWTGPYEFDSNDVTIGSNYRFYYGINGLSCNTEYKVKVKVKGRLYRSQNIKTKGCGEVACPYGGYYDGANCQIGKAPDGTDAFIWGGNYYYTPLSGNSCPYPGSWYDGANCYVQAVPSGASPFIYHNHWYYVAYP